MLFLSSLSKAKSGLNTKGAQRKKVCSYNKAYVIQTRLMQYKQGLYSGTHSYEAKDDTMK